MQIVRCLLYSLINYQLFRRNQHTFLIFPNWWYWPLQTLRLFMENDHLVVYIIIRYWNNGFCKHMIGIKVLVTFMNVFFIFWYSSFNLRADKSLKSTESDEGAILLLIFPINFFIFLFRNYVIDYLKRQLLLLHLPCINHHGFVKLYKFVNSMVIWPIHLHIPNL